MTDLPPNEQRNFRLARAVGSKKASRSERHKPATQAHQTKRTSPHVACQRPVPDERAFDES